MPVEKIMFDVKNPENSSFVYKGFQETVLELLGLPKKSAHGVPMELDYNTALDTFLKESNSDDSKTIKFIKNRQSVISDYMQNPKSYTRLPMILKNTVLDIYYKEGDNPKVRNITKGYIMSLSNQIRNSFPLIVNMSYSNFEHDPNPQAFVMNYDRKYNLIEGFNLKYLTLPELRKLIMLSTKFPNIDMYYFYHGILKPYGIAKSLKMKLGNVKKLSASTLSTKLGRISTDLNLRPYKKYPKGSREGMKNYQGQKFYGDTTSKSVIGFGSTTNILNAYRKYHINMCTFFNVPVDFFNENI